MTILAGNLFFASIFIYFSAAAVALIFIKRPKVCNLLSNSVCIAASAVGASASVIKLLSGDSALHIGVFQSAIPFISMDLVLDNLSAIFLLALSILVLCVSIYSIGYISHYIGTRNVGLFHFLYAAFILSMVFVFTSSNAVFFYIAWEAMSLLSYFLVIFESERDENRKAGLLYIIMTHIATAFLLIGFMLMYHYTGSFDLLGDASAIPDTAKNIIFVLFLLGFGTKAGVVPLHIWLPLAHPAAPSNVSALMSGIMIKTAIYGLIRFLLCYLGIQHTWWGVAILCIGVVSASLGISYALMENNVKRLLAFSSVENIGIILIGLGVSFIAFSQGNDFLGSLGLIAALLHTFNHTLFKGGLFLGAGAIQYATHTKDMEQLGGLIKKMPFTALFMLCFSIAVSAIVPFNGFISEWLTYQSLFANIVPGQAGLNILSIVAVAALGLVGALAAACFVKLFGISFLGLPRSEHAEHAHEVPAAMTVGMGILAAACLFIGLFPLALLKLMGSVASSVSGCSVFGQLRGGFLFAYAPLQLSENSISPLACLLALAAIILIALLILRIIGGKYIERKYGTWDCGFEALSARMQYTATGFSKPIKIVFRILFRPARKVTVTGDLPYHPESIEYSTTSESIIEKYLYRPFFGKIQLFSRGAKFRVQTGSIHNYLFYILVAILVLLAYNKMV